MNKLFLKRILCIVSITFFIAIAIGKASATTVLFTDNGSNVNLGHSFTEADVDGISVSVTAFAFSGSDSSPSSSGVQNTFMESFGNFGIGIGGGNNPAHTAENNGHREFFLIEFAQPVNLNTASISEWGNSNGSTSGGDSDIDYWGGAGSFDWDNLGTRFENDIPSNQLSNGQTRQINFDDGLGNINWLLLGPEAFDSGIGALSVHDSIKLRNISFEAGVGAVPLPASVWFMGTALLSIFGFTTRKR